MGEGALILVVDDDPDMLHLISVRLGAAGYRVMQADSGEMALSLFRESRPRLVITDLRMGGMDGLALFDQIQLAAPTMPVIILTAHGTIPEAVSATRRGVFSFLTKPFDGQELLRRVSDAIRLSPALDTDDDSAAWRSEIITADVDMEELLRQAWRIASDMRTCMLVGPSGAGKATLARAMHKAGPHRDGPFIQLSCADHPAQTLDALFAPKDDDNIFRKASGGVLHIQDVGTLPPLAQSRLFSALFSLMQAQVPLQRNPGAADPMDVHVIVSSPRPLDGALAENTFRSDLFYLLTGATLVIPPLQSRPGDIPLLAQHFLATSRPGTPLTLSPEGHAALASARWPGNVRQLKNLIEQVAALTLTPVVPEAIVRRVLRETEEFNLPAFDDARRDFERDYLLRLLQATNGNVSQAARMAQRNRTEFYKLLARHGLDPASFKQKFR